MTLSPLEAMGLPLYYRIANAEQAGFAMPENRHGQSIRTWVRSLTAMQKEALVTSGMTGNSWRLASDEGTHIGGYDVAPNPLSFVAIGMAASYMNEFTALAKLRGIAVSNVDLTLENYYYREGSFPRGTMVSGALPPEITVSCDADADDETMVQLLFEAVSASPLNGLLIGAHDSLFTLKHNGRTLQPTQVGVLHAEPYADPGDNFPNLVKDDTSNTVQPHIEKIRAEKDAIEDLKKSPVKSPELPDGQSLLHMHTQCRLRPDGLKEITKKQYAPTTSTWRFLSDEADGFGGQSRAPDAASYLSAGIAFCFMTQLSRYSNMAKIPMKSARVIQDTHFSPGGASGNTGKAGIADPVETHTYLDTDSDDETAQTLLGVAERTCFLHAFCRNDLKAKSRFIRHRLAASG